MRRILLSTTTERNDQPGVETTAAGLVPGHRHETPLEALHELPAARDPDARSRLPFTTSSSSSFSSSCSVWPWPVSFCCVMLRQVEFKLSGRRGPPRFASLPETYDATSGPKSQH